MDIINEKNSCLQPVSFYDDAGVAVVPTSATYRIDDLASGTEITGTTVISALAASVDISITAAENAMQSQNNSHEVRIITVEWTYGAGRNGKAQHKYKVKNLAQVA